MELKSNEKIELARGFILHSRANIFLTGKAGTGKTTLLRTIVPQLSKRAVIAAPTGVAALNAGGVTLHSLFQLPFGPHIPTQQTLNMSQRRISKNKLALIRSIELLIIDEISMVRSDVMDSIDLTLRTIRRSAKPFAGVQLLMIGDVQQLSPICRDDEWDLLREHYSSPYFFDSKALRKSSYISIELDEIFRQRDSHFTEILNAVRENRVTRKIFDELNRRHIPEFEPSEEEDYITLTTHNHTATMINTRKLAAIEQPTFTFEAKVSGDFVESTYPNDTNLELKMGAQVLFIKNDISPQKRYYNGLLGRIIDITDKSVTVQPKSGDEPIRVEAQQWENVDYKIGEDGEMEQSVKGTFLQMPIKCAWAITIHKSQGLSFERAIIDASDSFAHGQVYVALSRCRSIEGMVLRTPISSSAIVGDRLVEQFCDYVATNQPNEEQLAVHERNNYSMTLCEIFDFEILQRTLWDLLSELSGAPTKKYPKLTSALLDLLQSFEKDVVKVGKSFQSQLQSAVYESDDYANSDYIKERLRQASGYFSPRFEALIEIVKQLSTLNPDSLEAKRRIGNVTTRLSEMTSIVKLAMELCKEGFSITKYRQERSRIVAKETTETQRRKETKSKATKSESVEKVKKSSTPIRLEHKELYELLVAWRLEEAREIEKPAFCILPNRTLIEIQNLLPKREQELCLIVGMGKVKMERYADQILDIVNEYCFNNNI